MPFSDNYLKYYKNIIIVVVVNNNYCLGVVKLFELTAKFAYCSR